MQEREKGSTGDGGEERAKEGYWSGEGTNIETAEWNSDLNCEEAGCSESVNKRTESEYTNKEISAAHTVLSSAFNSSGSFAYAEFWCRKGCWWLSQRE